MAYNTDGTVGVNLDAVVAGTTTDGANAEFPLGTIVNATDGQMYMYVQAAEAITQYDAVAVNENYQMSQLTKTEADDGWMIGFAQIAFADNDLGWVAIKGPNLQVRVLTSCLADVAIYTSGTAGVLDDSSTSQTKIDGVVMVSTNANGSTVAKEAIVTWAKSTTF